MTGPTLDEVMRDPGVIDHSAADDDDEKRIACARKAAAKPRRSWLLKRGAR